MGFLKEDGPAWGRSRSKTKLKSTSLKIHLWFNVGPFSLLLDRRTDILAHPTGVGLLLLLNRFGDVFQLLNSSVENLGTILTTYKPEPP